MSARDREIIRELNADRWAEEEAAAEEDQRLSREIARGHFGGHVYETLTGEDRRRSTSARLPAGPLLSQIRSNRKN
jgi:hypothetical protein